MQIYSEMAQKTLRKKWTTGLHYSNELKLESIKTPDLHELINYKNTQTYVYKDPKSESFIEFWRY